MHDAVHVQHVLLPGRLIEVVLRVQVGLDLGGNWLVTVPWSAWRDVHQRERDQRHEQQDGHEPQDAAENEPRHWIGSLIWSHWA